MPLDILVGFALGYGVSRLVPPVRRVFVPRAKRRAAVDMAAKAAFVDLGVTRTTGRTGVLVFVSIFEQMVIIVCDIGVTKEAQRATDEVQGVLEGALTRSSMRAFAEALEGLGPRFAPSMARSADDVNELPDEVA
jgi:putative membrane protein